MGKERKYQKITPLFLISQCGVEIEVVEIYKTSIKDETGKQSFRVTKV